MTSQRLSNPPSIIGDSGALYDVLAFRTSEILRSEYSNVVYHFSGWGFAIVYSGTADLTTILQEEAEGKYIKRVQEETEERGGMLVIVSGTDQLRDQLRDEVRGYLDNKLENFFWGNRKDLPEAFNLTSTTPCEDKRR
ncbi:hypothetical protein DL98DRAFT_540115 [Cadophora sp. DSE1049]|nr:hypothetical protein DL98DRAFT_540115 [Cadophora sp. DSE1049]